MTQCAWYSDILPGDEPEWGEQAVGLGALHTQGVVVPPGFVVGFTAGNQFIAHNEREWNQITHGISGKKSSAISTVAQDVRKAVRTSELPTSLEKSLREHFEQLRTYCVRAADQPIHVVLATDGTDSVQLKKTLIRPADFLKAYKELYSLTLTETALASRLHARESLFAHQFIVHVQVYEESEFSGEAFSHDPEKHDDLTIQIEAVHLEKPKVANLKIEDIYKVDKKSLTLLSRKVARQWWAENRSGKYVSPAHMGKEVQTLPDDEVI